MAAGIAGINLGSSSDSQITTALAIIQSREFIRQFIDRHNVLVPLFAGTWDSESMQSGIDETVYDSESSSWIIVEPSNQQAYRLFRSLLSISEDQQNNLVTLAIEWKDPVIAKQWVDLLVNDINLLVKQQDLEEATSAIDYLRSQLEATQLVEMQQVFYQLIETQTRIIMLADVREDYVFKVIDPAVVPESRVRPNRTRTVLYGTILGFTISIIILILSNAILSRQRDS